MKKIDNPITYMKGEGEAQVLMEKTLDLVGGFLKLNLVPFDLNLELRDKTNNQVVREAAQHLLETKVAIKAPTVTPREGETKNDIGSPNLLIRKIIDGIAIVREGNLIPGVKPMCRNLKYSISVIRKATEGIYGAKEWEEKGVVYRLEMMTKSKIQALMDFAIEYARENKMTLYGVSKDTISKVYEGTMQRTFDETAKRNPDVPYEYWLIDAAYQKIVKHEGNLAIVAKNYDGDCLGDMVPAMFGSIAACGSMLVGKNGVRMYDPPHGTIPRHLGKNDANPLATIIAVSGAISYWGILHSNEEAKGFGRFLKESALEAIREGVATRDLLGDKGISTTEYLNKVVEVLYLKTV